MIENFLAIGLNEKESRVYLYLIEYGISGASEIAKHLGYPKSTVNFLADTLWKSGYLAKSIRGNTHYYEADIDLLATLLAKDREEKGIFLESQVPILREMNRNITVKPKIVFFDGIENCKNAYLELLHVKGEFYEFGAHADLSRAFSEKFMDSFIRERVRKGIFCHSIGTVGPIEQLLQKKDTRELRELQIFDLSFGKIGSSIAIYDDKVLILNLEESAIGVRIQNRAFAETMKTIFFLAKGIK